MIRATVTPSAARDLLEIWRHVADDSIDAADRVIGNIERAIDRLVDMPGLGHHRDELGTDYRVWTVYSYLIVYRPDTTPIQVMRVVSGWRDLSRIKV